jgi:integral membrane sensor domain MASE1
LDVIVATAVGIYGTLINFWWLPEVWVVGLLAGFAVRPMWATIVIAAVAGFIAALLLHHLSFFTFVNTVATLLWALLARGLRAFAKWRPRPARSNHDL